MASIVRDKVDPEMSIEDIEEAMAEIAIERNIKDVGQLPLSEQVELQPTLSRTIDAMVMSLVSSNILVIGI
jgi:hypothetical protein